ncbi:hypothetical protein ILUMI_25060 [Ignelater luminosus]|uniref:Uncharacterized protein n=1 Tax=Ignelater luminosus TaxID=2038154 RepID=A0A8K0FY71_IGNLU|nr:hypothetical protein ILUMI_25060 [Ignelater luminosus]
MRNSKCTFNVNLQTKYPFVKWRSTLSDVKCEKCRTEFSVAHGGASDIEKHLRSEKHKNSDMLPHRVPRCLIYLRRAIHQLRKTWKLLRRKEPGSITRCARTETEAIVVNVLAPTVMGELQDRLSECNHRSKKIFLVLVCFFLPYEGIQDLLEKLQENDCSGVDEEYMKTTAAEFYKISKEYLEQWALFCEELQIYEWANLTNISTWEKIQSVMDVLIERGFIRYNQDTEVFNEYSLTSNYITLQKKLIVYHENNLKFVCSSKLYFKKSPKLTIKISAIPKPSNTYKSKGGPRKGKYKKKTNDIPNNTEDISESEGKCTEKKNLHRIVVLGEELFIVVDAIRR